MKPYHQNGSLISKKALFGNRKWTGLCDKEQMEVCREALRTERLRVDLECDRTSAHFYGVPCVYFYDIH